MEVVFSLILYQYFVLIARTSCPDKRIGSPQRGHTSDARKKKLRAKVEKRAQYVGRELKELSNEVLCAARGPLVPAH